MLDAWERDSDDDESDDGFVVDTLPPPPPASAPAIAAPPAPAEAAVPPEDGFVIDTAPPAALPPGWQRMLTADGREYFVDHNTQTTSWTRPAF